MRRGDVFDVNWEDGRWLVATQRQEEAGGERGEGGGEGGEGGGEGGGGARSADELGKLPVPKPKP